jgi:DNA-directed RNA polymerase subunit RPC12/RpoP
VKGTITAHKTVWGDKTPEEQEQARKQADTVSLRHYGHRVNCPACGSTALLQGKAAGEAKKEVSDDGIIERQVMRPETFQCVACGLKINGYSKLRAADLGDTYIATSHYDAIEYFDVDLDENISRYDGR